MPNIPNKYQQNIQVNHIQSHPMSNSAIKMASLPSEAEWVVPHLLNVLLLAARHAAKTASPRNPIKFRKQKSAIRFENNRKQQIAKLGSTWFTTFEKHGVTVQVQNYELLLDRPFALIAAENHWPDSESWLRGMEKWIKLLLQANAGCSSFGG